MIGIIWEKIKTKNNNNNKEHPNVHVLNAFKTASMLSSCNFITVFSQGYGFPGWPSPFSTPSSSDMDPPSVTLVSEKDKDNAWLYTLDPILLTIIVMSSLGVLLGAICAGLLLYCTCSYSGLSSRSSTTLENYNFELYDGIKHKVKINQQRCCSEAWEENSHEPLQKLFCSWIG